jgi:hypothetical protein
LGDLPLEESRKPAQVRLLRVFLWLNYYSFLPVFAASGRLFLDYGYKTHADNDRRSSDHNKNWLRDLWRLGGGFMGCGEQ